MGEPISLRVTDRRTLLIEGARSVAALTAFLAMPPLGFAKGPTWQEAMSAVLNGAEAAKTNLVLTMPEIAENGNVVPITLNAQAAANDDVWVKTVHVFATDNPLPEVAKFSFSKNSGKAEVTSRMRLAKSQKVVAVAELSDGKFILGEAFVKVTIGGCGG